jgi:hypothetical protein
MWPHNLRNVHHVLLAANHEFFFSEFHGIFTPVLSVPG